ncbi:MAG: hypothetical protein WEC75_03110 [Dehalococcoidia bacterium]
MSAWTFAPNNRFAHVAPAGATVAFDLERGLLSLVAVSGVSYGPQGIGGAIGGKRRGVRPAAPARAASAERPAGPARASKGATS